MASKKAGEVDFDIVLDFDETNSNIKKFQGQMKTTQGEIDKFKQKLDSFGSGKSGFADMVQDVDKLKASLKSVDTQTDQTVKTQQKLGKEFQDTSKKADSMAQSSKDAFTKIEKGSKEASDGTEKLGKSLSDTKDDLLDMGKGAAGDVFESLGGEALKSADGVEELSGVIGKGKALFNPYVAVVATATAGLTAYAKSAANTREIQKSLTGTINPTGLAYEEQTRVIKAYAHATGTDMAEATDIAKEANTDFGSSIHDSTDQMKAMLSVSAINNSGVMEAADAYTVAAQNNGNFGDSMQVSNKRLGESIAFMQNYGQRAEDLNDTWLEWGDTFAKTGQTSKQTLGILNAGMQMNARATDETANAWNEFYLRIGDGSKSTADALGTLGLSVDDTVANFNKGGTTAQSTLLGVIAKIKDLDGASQQAAVAQALFGTQGEEMIATTKASGDEFYALARKVNATKYAQDALNKATADSSPIWGEIQTKVGLTDAQLKSLKASYDENGLSALDNTSKQIVLGDTVANLALKYNLSGQAVTNLMDTYKLYSGQIDITQISQKNLTDGLDTLKNTGQITQSAFDLLNAATIRYRNEGLTLTKGEVSALNTNIGQLGNTSQISARQQTGLLSAVKTLGSNSITSVPGLNALSNITGILASSAAGAKVDINGMKNDINILGDDSKSAADKTSALKDYIIELGKSGIISAPRAKELANKIDDLTLASKKGSTSQDGLRGKIDKAAASIKEQARTIGELTLQFYDNMGPMGKFAVNQTIGKKNVEALRSSVDKQNGSLDTNAGKNKKASEATKTMGDTAKEAGGKNASASKQIDGMNHSSEYQKTAATNAASGLNEHAKSAENAGEKTKGATKKNKDYNAVDIVKKTFNADTGTAMSNIQAAIDKLDIWNRTPAKTKTLKTNKQGGVGNQPYGPAHAIYNPPETNGPLQSGMLQGDKTRDLGFSNSNAFVNTTGSGMLSTDYGGNLSQDTITNNNVTNLTVNYSGTGSENLESFKSDFENIIIDVTEKHFRNVEV